MSWLSFTASSGRVSSAARKSPISTLAPLSYLGILAMLAVGFPRQGTRKGAMSHSNLMAILSRADVTALIFLVLAGCPAAAEDSYGVLAYSPATGALATKFKC